MQGERTFAELTHDLASDAGKLVRNEVRLARAEAIENIRAMAPGLGALAAGVALAAAALTLVLLALAFALDLAMPLWLATLVAAAAGALCAWWAVTAGMRALSADRLALKKTAAQVFADLRMIKRT